MTPACMIETPLPTHAMKPLTGNNIEAELSYAYLHAVAAHAAVGCEVGSRHDDNAGVDARLTGWGPFPGGGYLNEVDIKVQLKATTKVPTRLGNALAYNLAGLSRYDDLRSEAIAVPRILVVLFLPTEPAQWLAHTDECLTLRKCAYWASLRGAPESVNKTAQTVYVPLAQRFDPEGLKALMSRISRRDTPTYEALQ